MMDAVPQFSREGVTGCVVLHCVFTASGKDEYNECMMLVDLIDFFFPLCWPGSVQSTRLQRRL